jgi:hypothetical protein
MRSFRTYFIRYNVKVAQSPVLTIHYLLKLQSAYMLHGHLGIGFIWSALIHFIEYRQCLTRNEASVMLIQIRHMKLPLS